MCVHVCGSVCAGICLAVIWVPCTLSGLGRGKCPKVY
uniref:Uncharacterized protein n=1 Tax=Anguilla anguilla TaxID=7936 RepID=A0A0E9QXU8_ANGAN